MPKTVMDLVTEARAQIENLSAEDALKEIASGNAILVDVREPLAPGEEILIELDREKTAAAGLNIFELSQGLGGDNFTMASGTVYDGETTLDAVERVFREFLAADPGETHDLELRGLSTSADKKPATGCLSNRSKISKTFS